MISPSLKWASPHYTPVNYVLMLLSVFTLSSVILGVLVICLKERGEKRGKKRRITQVLPAEQTSHFLVMEDLDHNEGTLPTVQSFVESSARPNVRSLKTQTSMTSVSGTRKKTSQIKSVHATM